MAWIVTFTLAAQTAGGARTPAVAEQVTGQPTVAISCPEGLTCDSVGFVDRLSRFHLWPELGTTARTRAFFYGAPGDVPLLGDWDCDGIATPAMYRSSTGFMYLRNTSDFGIADMEFFYGRPSDIPLAGDFDGDGCDTLAIYRPAEGRVYMRNTLGTGVAEYDFYFGSPGDLPFTGDFNGNGVDTIALHRAGTGFVYLRNANSQGIADIAFYFGKPGDRLVAGDWDGDGSDSVAAYRPSEGALYVKNSNAVGVADGVLQVGPFAHLVAGPGLAVAPPVRPVSSGQFFETLPPGAQLPTSATCMTAVRPSPEIRPENAPANRQPGPGHRVEVDGASGAFNQAYAGRIDGLFSGTTDEIIQWGSCKWGFDEDITRARAVLESTWRQSTVGDVTGNPTLCSRIGLSAPCPQSYGLLQVKTTIHEGTGPSAAESTAFNVDYALGWLRACFEGDFTWMGPGYSAGDEMGCVGAWYSGGWYDDGADRYIAEVLAVLAQAPWNNPGF